MEKTKRKLSPEEQYKSRKLAVKLYDKGMRFDEISEILEMGHVSVRKWVRIGKTEGLAALKPQPRGRKIGEKRHLTEEQSEQIQQLICDKRPDQLKLNFALWTRQAVKLLIIDTFQIDMPIRTVGEYLKRWGFTPQKPIVRAYEQQPEAVKKWLDETYPSIEKSAQAVGAEIHWADETAVMNTDVRGRGYQPKGQTPVRFASGGTRQKLSMISTVTNQGLVSWMIIDDSYNADNIIIFLESLLKSTSKKIYLIWDNLRAHHSIKVKEWVTAHADKIELFYLPAYSPDLNPDERLNADLKYGIGSTVAVRTKEKLKEAADKHMSMLSQNPERVKSYFQDKRTEYAA